MAKNWFDHMAQALATGTSRRQIARDLFAAATGASVGIGAAAPRTAAGQGLPEPTGDTGDGGTFLPLVQGGRGTAAILCPQASTCDNRHYCSDNQACRCLMSAEGVIRCGQIPSCDVPLCQTSADCAHLGEGYFCDTPYSGCCADGEQARCIAPCRDDLAACPPERRCGYSCCPEGEICVDGRCRVADFGPTTGTWTGMLALGSETIGVRFDIQEVDRTLIGKMYYFDTVANAYIAAGDLEGYVSGDRLSWTMSSEARARVTLADDGLSATGTYSFATTNDESGVEAEMTLERAQAVTAEIEALFAGAVNAY